MSTRPSLLSVDLWECHERRCLKLLREALNTLPAGPAEEAEDDLNRRLYFEIIKAHHKAASEGSEQVSVVTYEGRNPPVASDATRAPREHKRPDFYWAHIDHYAPEPAAAARQFAVECKRLNTASSSWSYTQQYIEGGVMRFTSEGHGYGKAARSGAMVGYLQGLDARQALVEINACAGANRLPQLRHRKGAHGRPIEFEHQLERGFAESPFSLTHLWS